MGIEIRMNPHGSSGGVVDIGGVEGEWDNE